eukprot:355106-Chlamydomonas_euryale.AAC.3
MRLLGWRWCVCVDGGSGKKPASPGQDAENAVSRARLLGRRRRGVRVTHRCVGKGGGDEKFM